MDHRQFRSYVADLEAEVAKNPAAFRRRVQRLIGVGYLYIAGLITLSLLLVSGGVAYIWLRRPALFAVEAIVVGAVLLYFIARALWWPKPRFEEPELDVRRVPRLKQRVNDACRALAAAPIHEIRLTAQFNASVVQVPRFGLFGGTRNILFIGMPLLCSLRPRQFDAVLGHEIGHISREHPKHGVWVGHISDTWQQMIARLETRNWFSEILFERFARWYTPRLDGHAVAMRRGDEFAADADAVRLTDRKTVAEVQVTLELRAQRYNEFWNRFGKRVELEPNPPAVQWTELPAFMADDGGPEERVQRIRKLEEALRSNALVEDNHPSLRDRLAAVGALEGSPDAEQLHDSHYQALTVNAAQHYLGAEAATQLQRLEREFVKKNAESWREGHKQTTAQRAEYEQFATRAAAGETLTPQELWQWASLQAALDGLELAEPALRRALEAAPDNAEAMEMLGLELLRRGDVEGVALLDRAMQVNPMLIPQLTGIVRRFLAGIGDAKGLAAAEERAAKHYKRLGEIIEERNTLTEKDTLVVPKFSREDLAALSRAALVHGIKALWIAEKKPKHPLGKALIVIVAHAPGLMTQLSKDRRAKFAERILEEAKLKNEPELLVVVSHEELKWFVTRVKALGGYHATPRHGARRAKPDTWLVKYRRPLIMSGVGAALIALVAWGFYVPERVTDRYGALPQSEVDGFNNYLAGIEQESGVDIRIAIDTVGTSREISRVALEEARTAGVGRENDRRGLLIFVDPKTGALRIEVGPALEGIFTDAFVGRILRAHTAEALSSLTLKESLVSTMFILHHRLRESALAFAYDPSTETAIVDSVRLAAGAGATFAGGAGSEERLDVVSDSVLEAMLGPGSTAEEAYQRYLTWLAFPVHVPKAGFLTPASQSYLAREIVVTPAYRDYLRYLHLGTDVRVLTEGDLAVVIATRNPLIEPIFFRKTEAGWQMDVLAEITHSKSAVGGGLTWYWEENGDEWDKAFTNHIIHQGPHRFRAGANQEIVWKGTGR